MTDEGVCLDCPEFELKVENMTKARMFTCSNTDRQKWNYNVQVYR